MIQAARRKKGLTQKELGNLIGLSQGYVAKLESRKTYYDKNLSSKTILKISKVLDLDPVDVFIFIISHPYSK